MSVSVHQLSDADYRATLRASTGTEPADRTEGTTDDGFGALATERGNLPLETLDVRSDITGTAAAIELTQGFRNPYPEPLEATYIFPLPDRAAVTGMRMEANDRTIEGVLKERGEARAEYDKAIAKGRRASIAEEERPNVFTMRVGNIQPGERVTVTMSMALQLAYEDGVASLRFPLVVAPRYIPGAPLDSDAVGTGVEPDTDAVPDASRITPPVLLPGCPNPVALSISADIDPAGLPLAEISSSLHAVKVEERSDGRTHVEVHPGERADRDFVLCLRLADKQSVRTGLSVVPDRADAGSDTAERTGEGSFTLTVLPPTGTTQPSPRDVVLVLDRSGSMTGWKVVAARRAAARIIDTLTSRDRFAVLAFDTVIEAPTALPDGLVEATDRYRFRAVEHLAGLSARGGTEMLQPLRRAADLLTAESATESAAEAAGAPTPDRERTLVLVTDGQVGNEDQILRELSDRIAGSRIHAVGIDRSVNEGFLRRIATLGGGRCELVESEDRLDAAMEAIHRRVGTPLVTDPELVPDGLDVIPDSVAPGKLPAIYAGAPLVVHGRYRTNASDGGVKIRGRAAGGAKWERTVPAVPSTNTALAAVWARAHIRDLEDRYVALRRGRGQEAERLEREITETSLCFGVLSRFTAYVAVDTEVVNEGGSVRRVTQPVETPQGWEMFAQSGAAPMLASMGAGAPEAAMPAAGPPGAAGLQAQATAFGPTGIGATVRQAFGRIPPRVRPGGPVEAAEPPEVTAVRQAMAEWLTRLREATDRAEALAGLADRLDTAVLDLERAGADTLVLRPLRELRDLLRAPIPAETAAPVEIDRRWLRAIDVLESFAAGPVAPTPPGVRGRRPPGAARSGPFWKR